MGNYNPRAPVILGEEWVPIRDENQVFSPAVNSLEVGHGFVLATARQVTNARFYVNELFPRSDRGQTFMAAVYPSGTEDQSGPISRLVTSCNAATLTNATVSGAPTAIEALATQSTSSGISLDCSQPNTGLALNFDLSAHALVLTGKRILSVNLLTGTAASADITGPTRTISTSLIKLSTTATIGSTADPEALFGRLRLESEIDRTPFGEINQFWTANSPTTIADRVPWTYAQLTRLDAVATRIFTRIESGTNRGTTANSSCYIFYAALEVIYCEEKRLIVGATQFGTSNSSHSFGAESVLGANQIVMHDIATSALTPVLAAGNYLLTLSSADVGGLNDNQAQTTSDYPNLNACRELYAIPPHPGRRINLPFPLIDHIGDPFASEFTHILPQLSLHASGGTLTEPHVYGRQAVAQVYGVNKATQDIYDDISGASASYPQVRFYARRFGDTTVPLTLAGTALNGMTLTGAVGTYASTPDNAALDIVGDIDIRADVAMTDWTPAGDQTLIAKYTDPANDGYRLYIQTNGRVIFSWSPLGVGILFAQSSVAPTVSNFGRLAIRVTMDVDDGAGNRVITFYTAPSISEPWTQLGAAQVAGVTSIFAGTAILEVGSVNVGTATNFIGTVYAAQVYNGIAGTLVANPDFMIQPAGTLGFTDSATRVWTLNGAAAIVAGATASSSVSITPNDFDQLVEILDGWREVTLRFATAPSMGAVNGTPRWAWSANGESGGNRWEVLGASAPAVSGVPGNLYNLVPSPNQLDVATYQPSSGAAVNLSWMPQGVGSPWATAASADVATDAVLIFSQDPATVTGVALTARTQVVTGFALDCGSLPCCIPTGIPYQQVTWAHQGLATLVEDAFGRTVVNGFGSPDVGGAYTITAAAASYQVNGTEGTIAPPVAGTTAWATTDIGSPDFDVTAQMGAVGNIVAGSSARVYVTGRFTDASNYYAAYIQQVQAGAITLIIEKAVAGVVTAVASDLTLPTSIDGGARVNIRLLGSGSLLKAKAWAQSDPQPITWDVEATDTSLTTGNRAGVGAQTVTATGNVLAFDNLRITVPSYWFGAYELQRYDTVEGAFDTIMLATDIMQTTFNDYESRVGINSVYRIRALNALNFAGAWSLQVTGSVPVPGVTGGCADSTGALVFTSNADQTGLHNAAYVMQWEQAPIEDFSMPEADMVQFQPMYGRDGSVAFHGTERGLERFDRVVLINAAAIDPVRLADAKTIRDLAWADLPYVCVRDEIGDRWFASVSIPTVNARLNRTKYFARVEITEVTQTPAAVDP